MSVVAALQPVVEVLERLGIAYHVGGSVASSVHGSPRSTNDVDLVVDLRQEHVHPLCAALVGRYYASPELLTEAIQRRSEDILLRKLEWYRAGGELSDRQWSDVLGILRLREHDLDRAYLQQWATDLHVDDLLARALREVEGRN